MPDNNVEYGIFFSGEVQAGQSVDAVKARMATLFRLSDHSRLDRYFSGARILIKGGLTLEQATDYQKAVAQTGAVVELALVAGAPAVAAAASPVAARPQPAVAAPPPRVPAVPPLPAMAAGADASDKIWLLLRQGAQRGPYSRSEVIQLASAGEITAGDQLQQSGSDALIAPGSLPWLLPALSLAKKPGKPSAAQKQLAVLAAINRRNSGRLEHAALYDDVTLRLRARATLVWYLLMPVALLLLNHRLATYDIALGTRLFYIGTLYGLPGLLVWLDGLRAAPESNERKLMLAAGAMAFSAVLTVLAYEGVTLGGDSPVQNNFPMGDGELQGLVLSINRTVPQQIDDAVRLDGTSYADNTLRNKVTLISIDAANADKNSITQYAWAHVAKTSCWNSRLLATMRDKGLAIAYDFYDRNGELITSVPVLYAACTAPRAAPAALSLAAETPATPEPSAGSGLQTTDTAPVPATDASGAEGAANTALPSLH